MRPRPESWAARDTIRTAFDEELSWPYGPDCSAALLLRAYGSNCKAFLCDSANGYPASVQNEPFHFAVGLRMPVCTPDPCGGSGCPEPW